jgi:hypothetical protein
MSVNFEQTTRLYIPEDRTHHNHRCESLKTYIFLIYKYVLVFLCASWQFLLKFFFTFWPIMINSLNTLCNNIKLLLIVTIPTTAFIKEFWNFVVLISTKFWESRLVFNACSYGGVSHRLGQDWTCDPLFLWNPIDQYLAKKAPPLDCILRNRKAVPLTQSIYSRYVLFPFLFISLFQAVEAHRDARG